MGPNLRQQVQRDREQLGLVTSQSCKRQQKRFFPRPTTLTVWEFRGADPSFPQISIHTPWTRKRWMGLKMTQARRTMGLLLIQGSAAYHSMPQQQVPSNSTPRADAIDFYCSSRFSDFFLDPFLKPTTCNDFLDTWRTWRLYPQLLDWQISHRGVDERIASPSRYRSVRGT